MVDLYVYLSLCYNVMIIIILKQKKIYLYIWTSLGPYTFSRVVDYEKKLREKKERERNMQNHFSGWLTMEMCIE